MNGWSLTPALQRPPVSGTRVRADVPGKRGFLEPAVRAALALKIVVVGTESTGTTTLSRALVDHLRARWR